MLYSTLKYNHLNLIEILIDERKTVEDCNTNIKMLICYLIVKHWTKDIYFNNFIVVYNDTFAN